MRRIFYFSGHGLKIYEWQGRQLLGSCEFEPDPDGFAEFSDYLTTAPPLAAQLLVDVIEEDFRRATIPHVGPSARKTLLTRLLDRHYRDEPHKYAAVLSRSKDGRRDDEVLLAALPEVEALRPWLEIMLARHVPVAGIWSLPLLSEQVLKAAGIHEANALVVSRHIRQAQRETFFKNGQLLLSRLAKLERSFQERADTAHSFQQLTVTAEQIRHFVTNQRIIGFTDTLSVVCLVPDEQVTASAAIPLDTAQIKYRFVGLGRVFEQFQLRGCEHQHTDALLSYVCSRQPLFRSHYGQPEQKQWFHRYLIGRAVRTAATVGVLTLLTGSALIGLNTIELKQQQQAVEAGTTLLSRRHASEFAELEQQLADAPGLQTTVEIATQLAAESRQSPQAMFEPLSRVFGDVRFQALELNRLEWQKYQPDDADRILREAALSGQSETTDEEPPPEEYETAQSPDSGSLTRQQAVLRIAGTLDRKAVPYRQTVTTMQAFAAALEALPEVARLQLVRSPVDIRPKARFSDRSGLDSSIDSAEDDQYEILLLIQRARHD